MAGGPPASARDDAAPIRTFLIADIRGYTTFTQTRGDEAAAHLAAAFADVANDVIGAHGGRVQELRGDEAMCVFSSPRAAIRAAVELQRRFVERTISDPAFPFGVGVGIDAGEAVRVKGGFRGGALNLAARLCSIAKAGEILASREAVHLARQIDQVDYVERGPVPLKGIDPPPVVVRVVPKPDPAANPAYVDAVRAPGVSARAAMARRRRQALVVAAVAGAVLLADIGVAIGRSPALRSIAAIGTNAVGVVNIDRSVLFSRVPVGAGPGAITASPSAVWVANSIDGTVSAIDLKHAAVANTLPVGKDPSGIAVYAGAVWVSNAQDRTLSRIDERSKIVVASIPVGNGPTAVAGGAGHVWVANALDGTVSVVDPSKGTSVATIPVGATPSAVAVGAAGVWVANAGSATVTRIATDTRQAVATVEVGNDPSAVLVADGWVWVANALDGTVSRIDPARNTVADTITVGGEPSALAASHGAIWVTDPLGDRAIRVDVKHARIDRTVALGNAPQGAVVAGGRLWLSARGSGRVHRGGTLRLAVDGDNSVNSFDPAVGYRMVSWSVESDVYDGLVAFQRVGGPGGGLIVPDLASSLPSVSDGGRTYSFQLRQGIRFSTGRVLRASDVFTGLRRALLVGVGNTPYFDDIVGAAVCREQHHCGDLARGVAVDDATGSVVLHLNQPQPELLYRLALPFASIVGPGAPAKDMGGSPLVGTGPYVIAPNVPDGRMVLRRNPYFHEWSHLARPDGYPDEIDITFLSGDEHAQYVKATAAGHYDYAPELLSPDDIAALRTSNPTQLHPFTFPLTRYEFLNVHVRPFNDVRVRRALNLAIDRSRVVSQLRGDTTAQPTCQVLPPSFYGYLPYCPYTLRPSASGVWTGPDLAAARRLVAESGTQGARVTLFNASDGPMHVVGESVAATMRSLGYRVTDKVITGNNGNQDYYDYINVRSHHPTAGPGGWIADYPAPSNFIDVLLSCAANTARDNQNPGEFCDPAVDAKIKSALDLQTTDPAAAGAAWAAIDHQITDLAPWVSLTNDTGWDLVSARVGNYQHHPEWGALFDQFWVQ